MEAEQIPVPSADLTTAQIRLHDRMVLMVSVYVEGGSDEALEVVVRELGRLIRRFAIGTLKAYAFITQREEQNSFDIHRLVRLVMRNWLDEKGQLQECYRSVLRRLAEAFPFPKHENREVWMKYLPHARTALESGDNTTEEESDLLVNVAESYSILGKYKEASRGLESRPEKHCQTRARRP
jgi:hypothetical protein